MKRITTAIAASTIALGVAATGAQAQSANEQAQASADLATMQGNLIRSRDITGGSIFTTSMEDDKWTNMSVETKQGEKWNKIGSVEDVVLSTDGQMVGIVAEVGGFLGVADKHVVMATQDVKLVATDDKTYAFVTRMSEEQLETLPAVDEGFWD